MKKTFVTIALTGAAAGLVLLSGCSATTLSPEAQKVMITKKAPKKSEKCKYVGMVTANQGNFFTGGFTSNQNLQQGAFNDLRNQAAKLGGNRVVLLMNQAAMTFGGGGTGVGGMGGGSETNVALSGNVYKCANQ